MKLSEMITGKWADELREEFEKPYFVQLESFVKDEYSITTCYPKYEQIFTAFEMTPFEKVKVVILGQDPYHEPGQAQGLAFYVPEGIKAPPSLMNIAKELEGMPDLMSWARQGVLLLNATLTVRGGHDGALSHQKRGWEEFTDAAVRALAEHKENLVFILWGAHAQKKGAFIDRNRHCVIESAHPSPLSARRGFFGSRPFSRANEYLSKKGVETIKWR